MRDRIAVIEGTARAPTAVRTGRMLVPIVAGFNLQAAGGYDWVRYLVARCAVLFVVGEVLIALGRLRGE